MKDVRPLHGSACIKLELHMTPAGFSGLMNVPGLLLPAMASVDRISKT
jgi:hypothetical protein